MTLNITSLLEKARDLSQEKHKEQESEKRGVLRAGSTGALDIHGNVTGFCHRRHHLRSVGVDVDPPTTDKLIMFELGFANETVIVDQLRSALSTEQGYVILQEEEIPIEWLTSNGTRVTGRPDLVVCRMPEGKWESSLIKDYINSDGTLLKSNPGLTPVLGLELKSVHSMWTARDVLFGGTPKLNNLIQAAHYMWKLGEQVRDSSGESVGGTKFLPYKLVYKSYSQLGQGVVGGGGDWILKMFPAPGEPGSDYIEYSWREDKKTGQEKWGIKHIRQFEIVYDLEFDATGRLRYKLENSSDWKPTIVLKQDIERYYEYVSRMGDGNDDLGPRPITVDAHGQKLNYTDCAYCPLQNTCDSHEKSGYTKWMEAVSAQVSRKNTDK